MTKIIHFVRTKQHVSASAYLRDNCVRTNPEFAHPDGASKNPDQLRDFNLIFFFEEPWERDEVDECFGNFSSLDKTKIWIKSYTFVQCSRDFDRKIQTNRALPGQSGRLIIRITFVMIKTFLKCCKNMRKISALLS